MTSLPAPRMKRKVGFGAFPSAASAIAPSQYYCHYRPIHELHVLSPLATSINPHLIQMANGFTTRRSHMGASSRQSMPGVLAAVARVPGDRREAFATGIEGLDEALGGGLPRGSRFRMLRQVSSCVFMISRYRRRGHKKARVRTTGGAAPLSSGHHGAGAIGFSGISR